MYIPTCYIRMEAIKHNVLKDSPVYLMTAYDPRILKAETTKDTFFLQ